jgi:Transcriptional regulator containing GAF, AAA-type ATPase, and DNA binding domains
MSLATQERLLRTLQEKERFRIGGDRVINIDVRIIAASNLDL